MKHIEYKNIVGGLVSDVDQKTRSVKVVFSKMGNTDLDDDIIVPGAFTKSVSERGPKGSNEIWHLTDHRADLKSAVGKPSELYEENDQLIGVTKIANTSWGNDVMEMYTNGMINQHSVGFSTILSEYNKDTNVRLIKEIKLYEGSAVLWGANPQTPTLQVWKNANGESLSLAKRLEMLTKAVTKGTFTDETMSLFEIQMKQLQVEIEELATVAAAKAQQPEVDKFLLDAINNFNNKFLKS